MGDETKKVNIIGNKNKCMVNKLIQDHKEQSCSKKRIVSEKWTFLEEYSYIYQIQIVKEILQNNYVHTNDTSKTIIQEINKKISSYKQQDIIKKRLDEAKFVNFETIIQKMVDVELKCRYCNCEMLVLYDISREMKQWSVDRVDNDKGHNNDNFHLACLDCNLKKRRRSDEKFLFTKQLNIIKQNN